MFSVAAVGVSTGDTDVFLASEDIIDHRNVFLEAGLTGKQVVMVIEC